MKEKGIKNKKYIVNGIKYDAEEGKLFYFPAKRSEAMNQFRTFLTPIFQDHLRQIDDEKVRQLKAEYWREWWKRMT